MFQPGQRWYSESEPELGLGIVEKQEGKTLSLFFPLGNENRIYGIQSAPLRRFKIDIGDSLKTLTQEEYTIEEVLEQNGLYFYRAGETIIPEMDLHPEIDLAGALDRVLMQNFDQKNFFDLRYDTYLNKRHYESFEYKGFLGPKIRLIPHQIYIAHQVLSMPSPKALLCDEVGLGKTIEACIILNSLLQQEKIGNFLLLVPDSLVNQWFIELYKKFNISATAYHSQGEVPELDEARFLVLSTKIFKEDENLREYLVSKTWDALIIDESHQFDFTVSNSAIYESLEKINFKTISSLFLSATPEVLGAKNLFHQLSFLDPSKYTSFDNFQKELERSQEISQLIIKTNLSAGTKELTTYFSQDELTKFGSPEEIKNALIDRFGTGRIYFRNSRSNLEKYSRLFNDRILHAYPLSPKGNLNDKLVIQAKTDQLLDIIYKHPNDKILVICHSKTVVLKIQKTLMETDNFKLACFHSEQSLLERDRQAAYFADEEGAQILLSTEVGSEGRNFEFASHLVLFDLPKLPDQLEQRIGRLDRIGQKNDINVHVPYIKNTFEDIMFRWYKDVLNSFESSPKGANHFYEKNHQELHALLENQYQEEKTNQFISNKSSSYKTYEEELEKGRDFLVETHSYNDIIARKIIKEVESFQDKTPPLNYLDKAFDSLGIHIEDLTAFSYFVKPNDNMLIPSMPGLTDAGINVSPDREFALKFDHTELLSWEHPLVKNTMEIFLNSSLGNAVVAKQEEIKQNPLFEYIVVLQCKDEHKHNSQKYLPFTPIRVLLNPEQKDVTKSYPKKFIDEVATDCREHEYQVLGQIPKDYYKSLNKLVFSQAIAKTKKYKEMALQEYDTFHQHEVNRVNGLHLNLDKKQELLHLLKQDYEKTKNSILDASLSIDAIRIILYLDQL